MRRTFALTFAIALAPLGALVAQDAPPAAAPRTRSELTYTPAQGWVDEEPSSTMRKAQLRVPKVEGDSEDGSLVIFFFGAGQGGSVEDNMKRWIDQFQQPDGSPSAHAAKRSQRAAPGSGYEVHDLDISGTYVATDMRTNARENKPGTRLLASIVVTPGGSYFVKLTGPAATIEKNREAFTRFVDGLRVAEFH